MTAAPPAHKTRRPRSRTRPLAHVLQPAVALPRSVAASVFTPIVRALGSGYAQREATIPDVGNTRNVRSWKPRDGQLLYFAALCTLLASTLFSLRSSPLSPPWRLILLIAVAANCGFVYTTYVTTARPSAWLGKHGGVLDLAGVNALVLPITLCLCSFRVHTLVFTEGEGTGAAGACLVLFFVASLHWPYLARDCGTLRHSLSQQDMVAGGVDATMGVALKAVPIAGGVALHIEWLMEHGILLPRFATYGAVILTLVVVSRSVAATHSWHAHHWLCALLLIPLCATTHAWATLSFAGFALGQVVEGVARWSFAPPWHQKS